MFRPRLPAIHETTWQPAADVYRTREGWLVKFDVAGVRLEDLHVWLEGNQLCIEGTRRDRIVEEGCIHYRMEITYSHFRRVLELPSSVEQARLKTELREGMLLVRVLTPEEKVHG